MLLVMFVIWEGGGVSKNLFSLKLPATFTVDLVVFSLYNFTHLFEF